MPVTSNEPIFDERQQLEVTLAAMETRLRGMISDLMQPTIAKTSNVMADLETMKGIVAQHTRGLQDVQLGQLRAVEQVSTIASFKEEMSRWDTQRRAHEASVDESLQGMSQKLEAYRYSLEQKESVLHHLHRNVDRTAMELNRLFDSQESHKELLETRIDDQSRRINTARSETEVRIAGLELKHNALTDELWGSQTGLAKVAGELAKVAGEDGSFARLQASVDELREGKAEAAQLDRLRSEVGKMLHEANTSVTQMRQTVGNVVNDVREHFRTASQTISAHNATFITEVRQQYQDELQRAAKLRDEVQDFMGQVERNIEDQDKRVAETAAKASSLAAESLEGVEELNRRRKRDKTSAENELKALKKRLGGVFDNSDAVKRGIQHLQQVLQMMLEAGFIGNALEMQDTIDKKRIALMGVKDDETMLVRTNQMDPQRPRPECRAKTAPGGVKPGGGSRGTPRQNAANPAAAVAARNAQEPVVRVDNRCLSCSGQAPLVLSAFKMACLQYAPSPVDYEGIQHDRTDLMNRRRSLLDRSRSALLQTPTQGAPSPSPRGDGMGDTIDIDPLAEYAGFDLGGEQGARSGQLGAGLRLPNLGASQPIAVR
mmetsp:Transcript_36331/g.66011  ORF Transcript_36331/g.66011 Transcript_36331/m.66011 type:complete len:603 (+) Transcript_36331:2-1810(+)